MKNGKGGGLEKDRRKKGVAKIEKIMFFGGKASCRGTTAVIVGGRGWVGGKKWKG